MYLIALGFIAFFAWVLQWLSFEGTPIGLGTALRAVCVMLGGGLLGWIVAGAARNVIALLVNAVRATRQIVRAYRILGRDRKKRQYAKAWWHWFAQRSGWVEGSVSIYRGMPDGSYRIYEMPNDPSLPVRRVA